jgi:hypothetical protein
MFTVTLKKKMFETKARFSQNLFCEKNTSAWDKHEVKVLNATFKDIECHSKCPYLN